MRDPTRPPAGPARRRAALLAAGIALALAAVLAMGADRAAPITGAVNPTRPGQASSAAEFLAAVRGADPVVCALAARTLRQRWGGARLRLLDDVAGPDPARRELLAWAQEDALSDDDIDPLRAGLVAADACVRRLSAIVLGRAARHGRDRAAAVLAATLDHENATARQAAAHGLGVAEDRSALRPLLQGLADEVAEVRATAAWALGRAEDRGAVQPLIERLRDRDPRVRRNAAWALGEIEDRSALEPLVGLLRADADAGVRLAAAWALGNME